MVRMLALILSLLALNGICSCCKEPMPDPPPCEEPCDTMVTTNLEIIWQIPLRQDTSQCLSRMPVIFQDKVVFSDQFHSKGELFYCFDSDSGNRLWEWTDNKTGSITNPHYGLNVSDQHIIASMGSTYFINPQNGISDWWVYTNDPYCASSRSAIIGDHFYQIQSICESAYDTVSILRRTPLNLSMTWDTVFVTRPAQNDNFYSSFQPPALWIHPSGDSILIMKNRMITAFFPLIDRADLWAWNLSADSLLWKIEDFDPNGETRIGPPTIYNNMVFVFGGNTVYCYNLESATLLWSKELTGFSEGLGTAQPFIAEGIFVVKSQTQTAYGLNPESGSVIWSRSDEVGACRSLLAYHDGKVYYTGFDLHPGELYALDIHTGKTIWAEPSPAKKKYPDASFAYNGVAIDPVRKVLYTSDYYYAYCIKLPK